VDANDRGRRSTNYTATLKQLLADWNPIVIDPLLSSLGRSIPGAIRGAPIVAVGFNSERFDGRNLALRLVALGYTNVYWYRGGREAWEVAGLPETKVDVQDW
jgi:hypothetical protein